MRLRALLFAALSAMLILPAEQAHVSVTIDGKDTGRIFDGIGVASGGGGVSRLLINYPEPQRSEILDYLFKPNFGASAQQLKIEIGGDGNSTEGAEPSHMHTAGDENYSRGFEWWVAKEAKQRNPNIKITGLAWDYPAWVGDVNSQAAADYLVKWIEGMKGTHGIDIDYIGIWNETKTSYDFYKRLKKTLIAHNLRTMLSADDLVNTWAIADEVAKDPELRDAVDIVNTHYPHFQSTEQARKVGKPIWSTEDGPWGDEWGMGGEVSGPYAELFNRNYIEGRMTSTTIWCAISSYYDILDIPNAGLMRAATPWSGAYEVKPAIWLMAHHTQFVKPGWQYLDRASGLLPEGGGYVALKKGKDYSVVIESLAATTPQELDLRVQGGLSTGLVSVWRTNRTNWFEKIAEITPRDGKYSLRIEPDSVYSITTTSGQRKGSTRPPPAKPFPMPYRDNFDQYPAGHTTPDSFIEQNGAYEVVACAGEREGKCLRQVVNRPPIVWGTYQAANLLGTASLIGDKNWSNYAVSADAFLEEPGYARVMGRISRATLEGQIAGYQLYYYYTGKWELRTATVGGVIASGQAEEGLRRWRKLELAFEGEGITASIDGKEVARVNDSTYWRGMAGIGNDYNQGQYDNFEIRPVRADLPVIVPRPVAAPSAPPAAPSLYMPTALNQSVRLTWSPVEGAAGYKIKVGTQKGEYKSAFDAGALTAYKIWTLTNGTTYYFVVVAYNEKGESKLSNERTAVPQPATQEKTK